MGLFGKKTPRFITTDEAVQKISVLVNERDFKKLQAKLDGKQNEAYRAELKKWAIGHEDPEVIKVGRSL